MSKRAKIKEALARVKHRNGKLMPRDVISAARDTRSPLHPCFEWDDGKAAEQFRLWQAQHLIASVEIVYDEKRELIGPVYVSLVSDRMGKGGYRPMHDVLRDKDLRAEMLKTAMMELQVFKERFGRLSELASIFSEASKVERRLFGVDKGSNGKIAAKGVHDLVVPK